MRRRLPGILEYRRGTVISKKAGAAIGLGAALFGLTFGGEHYPAPLIDYVVLCPLLVLLGIVFSQWLSEHD